LPSENYRITLINRQPPGTLFVSTAVRRKNKNTESLLFARRTRATHYVFSLGNAANPHWTQGEDWFG